MTSKIRKRWLIILAGLLPLVVVAVLVLDPTRILWGSLRGESFYAGRPTSWWHREIGDWLETENTSPVTPSTVSSWIDDLRGWIGLRRRTPGTVPEVLEGNRETIPVLRELLQSDDVRVRQMAVMVGMQNLIGNDIDSAEVILAEALEHLDWQVRWQAAQIMQQISFEASCRTVPVLIEARNDADGQVGLTAIAQLRNLGPAAARAVPAIRAASRRHGPEFEKECMCICPGDHGPTKGRSPSARKAAVTGGSVI